MAMRFMADRGHMPSEPAARKGKRRVVEVRHDCAPGLAATRIAEALVGGNVLAVISSDYRARDVHAALKGAAPDAEVVFFPPSDALPGDTQPPTPANIGLRLAALRKARGALKAGPRSRVACITTAEAASELR